MIQSLGKLLPTAGTPKRATENLTTPDRTEKVHGVLIQALPSNTGKVYIGKQTLNKTTFADVYAILPAASAGALPSFSAAITCSPNGVNVNDFWIDVETGGDGVLVTVLVA